MPARASISINDAATTPLAHVYAVKGGSSTMTQYASTSNGATIAAAWESMTIDVAPPSGGRSTFKAQIGMFNPVEAVVDGTPVVVRSNSNQTTFNFPPDSTLQDRKDAVKKLANLLVDPTVVAAITTLEPFY